MKYISDYTHSCCSETEIAEALMGVRKARQQWCQSCDIMLRLSVRLREYCPSEGGTLPVNLLCFLLSEQRMPDVCVCFAINTH